MLEQLQAIRFHDSGLIGLSIDFSHDSLELTVEFFPEEFRTFKFVGIRKLVLQEMEAGPSGNGGVGEP